MKDFSHFKAIRKLYAELLPRWIAEYEASGDTMHDPYFFDFVKYFTPIESYVWGDIRGAGLPFYPQVPVLNYFLDFACPFIKVAIECDGAKWHDAEKDRVRDERLFREGWTVFRIPGHECNRNLKRPFERESSDDQGPDAKEWYCSTSAGIVHVIGHIYFESNRFLIPEEHGSLAIETFLQHCSIPPDSPIKPISMRTTSDADCVWVGDEMDQYLEHKRKAYRAMLRARL